MNESHTPDPRLEELLERWTWDPSELSAEELAELEASEWARGAMSELREVERELQSRGDAMVEDVLSDASQGVPHEALVEVQRIAKEQGVVARPATRFGFFRGAAAAAAFVLVALWGAGVFTHDPETPPGPDIPLGPGEFAVDWDRESGVLRWREVPPEGGEIRVWLRSKVGGVERRETFYEDDPEWRDRAFSVDATAFPGVFEYRIEFMNMRGETAKETRRGEAAWD